MLQHKFKAPISEAMRDAEVLAPDGLDRALAVAEREGLSLHQTLLNLGLISEEALAEFYAQTLEIPLIKPGSLDPATVISPSTDKVYLLRMGAVALRLNGEPHLAMCDPTDESTFAAIRFHMGLDLKPAVTTAREIKHALPNEDDSDGGSVSSVEMDIERLRDLADDGPIVRIVQDMLIEAVDDRASDIHVETLETQLRVRLRIDGMLCTRLTAGEAQIDPIISRLKILADLNIAERRRPQDGRIQMNIRGRQVDFRVSTLPTQFGESVVLRVLDQSRHAFDWESLGISPDISNRIMRLAALPDGLFIISGPTGSGKTTTLHTILRQLNTDDRKLFAVEDPIEYSIEGVNQIQVHPEINLGFADVLRGILRQDPNVVMVGEIRDPETAIQAVRASLTGRMVLSTVHTNSAAGVIDRLLDLGVPPYLLAATLRGALAQRLVRQICPTCNGLGCKECRSTGYSGRRAVHELLEVTPEIREAISQNQTSDQIHAIARQAGMQTLAEHGRTLIHDGLTSEQDIRAITLQV